MTLTSCPSLMDEALLEERFCAQSLFQTSGSWSVIAVGMTNLIVLERSLSQVLWIYASDGNGLVDSRKQLSSPDGLNHGLAINGGYLYASSDTTVICWPYQPGDDSVGGKVELVIINICANGMGGAPGGHTTHTMAFDTTGQIYVSVGSTGNMDTDSYRLRICQCDLSYTPPIDFSSYEVFADGLHNEVGLAFDKHGVLWGVENGADELYRSDLGGNIHNDNLAEELNRFPEENAGLHWAYPYCWTEFELSNTTGLGCGTQWAWPSFIGTTVGGAKINDEYCRTKTLPPKLSMQAHSAPLGITFYNYDTGDFLDDCYGSFPKEMDGYAFVAFHGSWNHDVPTGYKVVYIPMNEDGRVPDGEEVKDLLHREGNEAQWTSGF